MVPLFAMHGARDATSDLAKVHNLGQMLAEREEVRHGIHGQSKNCDCYCINHVSLCIVFEI